MNWFILAIDIFAVILLTAINVMYVLHAFKDHWNNNYYISNCRKYNAFEEIGYSSRMNVFGKIVCGIFVGITCSPGIVFMYICKFIYWAFHYKKGE